MKKMTRKLVLSATTIKALSSHQLKQADGGSNTELCSEVVCTSRMHATWCMTFTFDSCGPEC